MLLAALLIVAASELPHGRPALARPATRPDRELRGGGASPDHASPQLVAVAGAQQLVVVEETPALPARRRLPELPKLTPFAQICVNLMMWWALNVVFNLANKQCLNSWPHPWALACMHLAVGSACMLPLYVPLPRGRSPSGEPRPWVPTRELPRLGRAEWATLLPVMGLLSVGHVTSTLAPAFGTVAFSNIVKTAEPLFTCVCSMLLFRRTFTWPVYAALLMVVAGVALVSCRDVNFSSFSLGAGMISNAAFALYSIRAKQAMQAHPAVLGPRTAYALLTMGSCVALAPLALVMEGCGVGASRLASASSTAARLAGWRLCALLVFTGVVQYVSNEIAFCTLSMIHPVTYAVANTLKRSIVVASSLVFFKQRLPLSGYAGACMAIVGAFLYSLHAVR